MKGTFKTPEGETVLEDVDISLTTKGGSHSFDEWFGSFRTKRSNDFVSGEYRLELSDGRYGDVIVHHVRGHNCSFTGNGPLNRPGAEGAAPTE